MKQFWQSVPIPVLYDFQHSAVLFSFTFAAATPDVTLV